MASIIKVDTIQDVNSNTIISSDGSGNLTPNTFTALTISGDLTVDTDTLFVDASADKVGIGTTTLTTGANLTLSGQGFLTSGADSGSIAFGSNPSYQGRIYQDNAGSDLYIENTYSSSNGDIIVKTNGSERLRVKGDGNVGINTSSPATKLEVSDLTTTCSITIRSDRAGSGNLQFADQDDVNVGYIQYQHNNDRMVFRAGDNQQVYIDGAGCMMLGTTTTGSAGNGDLVVNGNIYLGGTGSANALDDYEEGTFTPVIAGTTSAGTGTYTVQDGDYTKIGEVVRINAHLRWSAHTGTGDMEIQNLPFTSGLSGTRYFIPSLWSYNLSLGSGRILVGFNPGNSSKIRLQTIATGGGTTTNLPMDTAGEVYATLVYRV